MSQNVNEPVPGQGPIDATAKGNVNVKYSGIVFESQVRDQTGASGGSASGVYTSQEFYNPTARGVRLNTVINPTGAATGTVTVRVEVADPATGQWTILGGTIGSSAFAVNGTGALTGALLTIYPGLTGIADASGTSGASGGTTINQHLGPRWRAVATVANAAETFTVGGDYLL